MKRTELEAMWKLDSAFTQLDLGGEAKNVSTLHSKYLGFLMQYKLQLRRAESEMSHLRRNKRTWYMGQMSEEDLVRLDWPQYLKKDILKTEADRVISEDVDVIKQMDKIDYIKTIVYALESIMKSIGSRGWEIKSAIEFLKFTNPIF